MAEESNAAEFGQKDISSGDEAEDGPRRDVRRPQEIARSPFGKSRVSQAMLCLSLRARSFVRPFLRSFFARPLVR